MAYSYSGNDDFRGWIAANNNLSWVNNYVGNDGRINYGRASNDVRYAPNRISAYGSADNFQRYVNDLYGQWQGAKTQNDYQSQLDSMRALINSMRTPQPRFISYDITASWNKAREMATQAVSPIYQQKMTDFINRQKVELTRQKDDTTTGKQALDLALNRLLADTQTQRGRTQEDTETTVGDIRDTQAFNARQEGLNFDAANRALTEGVGAAGIAESGLGQQQVQEAQQMRRDMSNEEVRQIDNKVDAAWTLMNRTFQDLTTKEARGQEDTTSGKKKLDLDLERFIQDQAYDKDQQFKQWELQKAADISERSIGLQGQLVDQWLASLSGQGYTAQEIANAASIYRH